MRHRSQFEQEQFEATEERLRTLQATITTEGGNLQSHEQAKERIAEELAELEDAIKELQEELKELQEDYDEKTKVVDQAKKKASKSAKALDQVLKEIASKACIGHMCALSQANAAYCRTMRSRNSVWSGRLSIVDVVLRKSSSL